MDSLRYWVLEMHVDGFRFDLASALARELYEAIHQDPVISQVKLIAEPWDVGPGGYQVGNFSVLWTEWNGRYRDAVRRFWRGDGGAVSELATRLAGSADLYEHSGRRPHASINFVTSHDGFTLHDLVSYNDKHNEANGEGNRDGDSHNLSWNCGAEGPTEDRAIVALRARQARNFLTTLFLSQGVPMIRGGDEVGQTQGGNNNAFCQDNEMSWQPWDLTEAQTALYEFACRASCLMKEHPVLRRRSFLQGQQVRSTGEKDVTWLSPAGRDMTDVEWGAEHVKCLGAMLAGGDLGDVDEEGQPIIGQTIMYLLNADEAGVPFPLPSSNHGSTWICLIDTADARRQGRIYRTGTRYRLSGRSVAVLRAEPTPPPTPAAAHAP